MGPAAPGTSQAKPARDVPVERLQWTREVDGPEPITTLEIRNDFGDIRARLAGDRKVEAWMIVQRLDPGPDHVGFTVERRGPVIALVASYPPGHLRDADPRPPKDSYDRLDLTVFVPEGVILKAHTLRGQVEVRGLRSDIEAATLDGPIFVKSSGAVQARTDSGEILTVLDGAALSASGRPLHLHSETGAIKVILPPRAAPELRIETSGAVESAVRLKRRAVKDRTVATAGEGAGTRLVLVTSGSGRVALEHVEQ